MKLRCSTMTALLAVVLLSCSSPQKPEEEKAADPIPTPEVEIPQWEEAEVEPPKRIILFIGDGMGVGTITAASYTKGEPLSMMSMDHLGFMTTHEYEFVGTDSAASATAIATGQKTHFQGLSVKPGTTAEQESDEETHLKTLLEHAQEAGWKTGLVSTSRINHATPGAFASHRSYRRDYEGVALDMSKANVDVMLGAGTKYFERRDDGRDLLAEMEKAGYTVARTPADIRRGAASAEKMVGLLAEKDFPYLTRGARPMSLPDMVEASVEFLDRDNDEGFFLMVEGSFIDWCAHELDAGCVIAETLEFDRAIAKGLAYSEGRDDTLVLATSDHETGGLSVLDPPYAAKYASPLGGEEAAREMTHLPAAARLNYASPPPLDHFDIGSNKAIPTGEGETDGHAGWGMDELTDDRLTTVFAHLSLASRPHFDEEDDYSGNHSVAMVPVFAHGAAAEYTAKIRDNADLGARLIEYVEIAKNDKAEPLNHVREGISDDRPRNVILMIGDGMGLNAVTAGYYGAGATAMHSFPVQGLASTHAVDRLVTDSAASGTAIATGRRTRRGAVGVFPKNGEMVSAPTLLERAESQNYMTGIISTTELTHATPASFYAHAESRSDTDAIARDFVELSDRVRNSDGVDLAIAGGNGDFDEELLSVLKQQGVETTTQWPPPSTDDRLLALLAADSMPGAYERLNDGDDGTPGLAEMTRYALNRLDEQSRDDAGFFLVVEGGQIDWALHRMERGENLLAEIADFDAATSEALKYAGRRRDTLVIVTSDHDHTMSLVDNNYPAYNNSCAAADWCGGDFEMIPLDVNVDGLRNAEGFEASQLHGDVGEPKFFVEFSWLVQAAALKEKTSAPHSANFVPVYAYGPGSTRFRGFQNQPEIGRSLFDLLLK